MKLERITGGEIECKDGTSVHHYRATQITGLGIDAFAYVATQALTLIPQTFLSPIGQLFLQDIKIHENHFARSYTITAPYGLMKREVGAYQITVDQTGGMVNVKAGRRIAGYALTAGDMVDNKGLIGVEGDDVKGADIPVEQTKIVVNYRHPQGRLSDIYIRAIGQLVGFPNADGFLGYQPGEVMFKGGQFSESNCEATATYNFDISYNRTNFTVGEITVAEKKGWDILSPTFKDDTFDNGTAIVAVKKLCCLEVIRPAGREWVAYQPVFGWGG